jgi:hypothetical protein
VIPEFGIGLKVFGLRSWSPSSSLPEGQGYGGVELELSLYRARVGVAWARRVTGALGKKNALLLTIGAGF